MKNKFDNVAAIHGILRDSMIGLWCMEIDEGKPERMYADDIFCNMMGMDSAMSPEESYRFWFDRVLEEDRERAQCYVDEMIQNKHSVIQYSWMHPVKGEIHIRCEGHRDPEYREGARLLGSHQDITEIVQIHQDMEGRLKQREMEYQRVTLANESKKTILNAIPGGVAVIRCTPEGVWVPEFLSKGFATMTDMSPEQVWELYRQGAMTGVHPEDQEQLARDLDEYFSSSKEYTELTYRLRKGDKGYFWVRNALTKAMNEKGEKQVYCVYRDMTQELEEKDQLRRQYQERLTKHYRAVGREALLASHCNISRNRVLEVVDCTDSGLTGAFGSEREAFLTGLASFVVDEEERRTFLRTYLNEPAKSAYAKGETELVQTCFIRLPQDIHGRYVRFKVNLIEEPDNGELMSFLAVMDVTEHTIREKLMRQLSATGYDMVADVDLYRDRLAIITDKERGDNMVHTQSYLEYEREKVPQIVLPEDLERMLEILKPNRILERLEEEDTFSTSYSIRDKKGRTRNKNLTVFAIDLRLGRVCFVRSDITDALEAERQSKAELERALAEAERASHAKSDFLASMSHDIRTPMNAIIGMTTLAEAHLDDRERLEDCLRKISMSSRHLLNLINNILDMNKIESSKLTLNQDVLYLSGLMEQMCSILQPQAQAAGICFAIQWKNIRHQAFCGDSLRLSQILINLIGNAIKFTPKGGSVELLTEEIPPYESGERVRYRFTVKDTGVGMSRDFMSHLFEPFVRSRDAAYVEGTGLGLSITKGVVELMGGTITVESEEHKGTAFRVELEFDIASEEQKTVSEIKQESADTESELPLKGKRFLAAEDNELNAEILCELLCMEGAQVEVKRNGALAVQTFRDSEPGTYDAVLMDIQMPVMNGYDAALAIRALERQDSGTIPIIAMTANAFAEDIQAALDAGMNAHVSKPIDMKRLCAVLQRLEV